MTWKALYTLIHSLSNILSEIGLSHEYTNYPITIMSYFSFSRVIPTLTSTILVVSTLNLQKIGCGSAIASSSLITEWVKGKSVDEAHSIKNTEIANHLALPPVKIHCSVLAEDAIKAAIADYKDKNKK